MLHSGDGVIWAMCCVGFVANVTFCISAKKFHLGFVRPQNFFHMASKSLERFFADLKWDSRLAFLSHGFILATLPYRPDLWSVWVIVVTCTQWPFFAIKSCSSFKVGIGLLVAFLISLLLGWSSNLEGGPDLSWIVVVSCAFHFLMNVFTVLQRIFKAFELFLYPSPDLCLSTTLSWMSFESSLVLMVESLLWNALPSRGNLQEQLILFWNNQNHYTLTQVETN